MKNKREFYIILTLVLTFVFATKALASLTFSTDAITGTSASTIDLGSGHNLFLQISNGNVGIGTTSPSYKLDIAGDTNITGTYRVNGNPISATSNWTSSGNDIYYTTGNVGIGTTTPASPLSVNGIIESITGGFKFPDGTTQTTKAVRATTKIICGSNITDQSSCDVVCPGTPDDQSCLNNAFIAGVNHLRGTFYVTSGTKNTYVNPISNMTLEGEGDSTILIVANGTAPQQGGTRLLNIENRSNVTVRDLKIDGNSTNFTGAETGIAIATSNNIHIGPNVFITNGKDTGSDYSIWTQGGGDGSGIFSDKIEVGPAVRVYNWGEDFEARGTDNLSVHDSFFISDATQNQGEIQFYSNNKHVSWDNNVMVNERILVGDGGTAAQYRALDLSINGGIINSSRPNKTFGGGNIRSLTINGVIADFSTDSVNNYSSYFNFTRRVLLSFPTHKSLPPLLEFLSAAVLISELLKTLT